MLNIEASKSRPFINLDDDNDTFSPERKYSLKEQFSMACFDFSQALAQYAPADLKGAGIKYLATAEQEMESGEMNEGDMKRAIKVMNNAIDKYKAMSGGQEVKQESVPQPLERDNSRKDNVSTIESVAVETENNENLSPQEQFEELSDNYLASINKHFTGSKREELIRVHEAKKNLVRNKKIDKRDIPYMVKAMKNAMKRWESGNNKPLAVPKLEINLND